MSVDPNQPPTDLGDLFRSSATPRLGQLDAGSIIRRTRRRRLPRKIGVGSVLSLAVAGIAVSGVSAINAGGTASTSTLQSAGGDSGVSGSSEDAPQVARNPATEGQSDQSLSSGSKRAPADRINLCGGTVAEVAPSETGLVLTTDFPDADSGATSIDGTVTLTNTGSSPVTGTTAATPAITLAQDGVVLWHSNGPMIQMAVEVDLKPGESMTYRASLVPVVCGVEDDTAEAFRSDLPAAPAGSYQVSAAIDLSRESGADLVTGPSQTITLR